MAYPSSVDPFRLVQDTRSILKIPNMWRKLGDMGLYQTRGSTQTIINVMLRDRELVILDPMVRGGEPYRLTQERRQLYSIPILHYYTESKIMGSDIQDRVDLLTGMRTMGRNEAIADKMEHQRMLHSVNTEYVALAGFIKGNIQASDSTSHLNIYDVFGITQKVIDFQLSSGAFKVRSKCMEVNEHIDLNLKGDMKTGVHALCSSTFFNALVDHSDVEQIFRYTVSSALSTDVRMGFRFGGITFEQYNASLPNLLGVQQPFIEDDTAYAFPLGTRDTFTMYFGPPNINSINLANTMGQEMYALSVNEPLNRYICLHTESNPLPVCRRPEVVVKLTMS